MAWWRRGRDKKMKKMKEEETHVGPRTQRNFAEKVRQNCEFCKSVK